MAIQYSLTHRNNSMTDLVTLLGATGFLLIYSGTEPASCATAITTQVLLASLPLSATAGTVSGGVLTLSTITSAAAGNNGGASFFRLCTSSAGTTVVAQGTCGTSGADLNFSSTSFTIGETIGVSSFTDTANGA